MSNRSNILIKTNSIDLDSNENDDEEEEDIITPRDINNDL